MLRGRGECEFRCACGGYVVAVALDRTVDEHGDYWVAEGADLTLICLDSTLTEPGCGAVQEITVAEVLA
jgi:hypothetical protein